MIPVILKKKIGLRIENGHPWIFGNEIAETEETVKPGDIVTVFNGDRKFIGKGYINPQSQIAIRLLTRNEKEEIDSRFIRRRIEDAWLYRQKIGYTENCRLVFGEADGLPALIIDKFGDHFVIQTLALGMEVWKSAIVAALEEIFHSHKIYERNDVPVRELEGMVQQKDFYQPLLKPGSLSKKMVFSLKWTWRTGKKQVIFWISRIIDAPCSIL